MKGEIDTEAAQTDVLPRWESRQRGHSDSAPKAALIGHGCSATGGGRNRVQCPQKGRLKYTAGQRCLVRRVAVGPCGHSNIRGSTSTCEKEVGGSSGSGSPDSNFPRFDHVPDASSWEKDPRSSCALWTYIRCEFPSQAPPPCLFRTLPLHPPTSTLVDNVRKSYRYRLGHHLLVSRLWLISRTPLCSFRPFQLCRRLAK